MMAPARKFILIFANGVIEDMVWVEPYLTAARAVIAADGGIRHVLALGRHPDVLIGDLDSLPADVETAMSDWAMEVVRYPAAKDETDLELALLFAKRRFPENEIIVLGAFGGRLDHTLANTLLLAHPELVGYPVYLLEGRQSAWLVTGEAVIHGDLGDTVSLIPLSGPVRVAETTGLRWPLHNEVLAFGPARGISNEMTAERATIRLEYGMLLCTHNRKGSIISHEAAPVARDDLHRYTSRLTIEPLLSDDLPAVADLINAHSLVVTGTNRALIDAYGDLRTARYIPDMAEQVIGRTPDGQIIAHAYWLSRPPYIVTEIGFTIHPDLRSPSWVDDVFEKIENGGRRMIRLAPDDARVVMQTTVLADDAYARQFLVEQGFKRVREWVHLELELTETPQIKLPDGITIRSMDFRRDWPAVGAVMDAAFADHWGEMGPQLRTLLEEDEKDEEDEILAHKVEDEDEDDPYSNSVGLCFVAEANGKVIGSCLCNARTIEWPDTGKLGSLSVLRPYRRRGVGEALTATALAEFKRRGIHRIVTDTDKASFTGANRLYARYGFKPYRYEQVYEKELRPGREWRALTPDDLDP